MPTIELWTTRSESAPLRTWIFAAVVLVRPIRTLSAPSVPILMLAVARMSSDPVVVMCDVVMPSGVNCKSEIFRSVGVKESAPLLAPVADVVAATHAPALSSYTNAAFALSPRSMMMPESADGVPVVPFASSISLSVTVVLVLVVVFPLTVRSPDTVRSLNLLTPNSFMAQPSITTVQTVDAVADATKIEFTPFALFTPSPSPISAIASAVMSTKLALMVAPSVPSNATFPALSLNFRDTVVAVFGITISVQLFGVLLSVKRNASGNCAPSNVWAMVVPHW